MPSTSGKYAINMGEMTTDSLEYSQIKQFEMVDSNWKKG